MASNINPYDPLAVPDFDGWGLDSYWDSNDWMVWHIALIEEYGEPVANDMWVDSWNSVSGFDAIGDVRYDWIAFDASFREHLKNHKTSTDRTMLDAVQNPLGSLMGGATDGVSTVGQTIEGLSAGLTNTAKTLSWALPMVAIVAGIVLVYILSKKIT